jgi:hypothetical protein
MSDSEDNILDGDSMSENDEVEVRNKRGSDGAMDKPKKK